VSLDVHHTIEVLVNYVNPDKDAIGETVDLEVRPRELPG